jgi:rhodanese-related sulfurtransferase
MSRLTISVRELAQLCRERDVVELIDVRTPAEYRDSHVDISQNVPLNKLEPATLMRTRKTGAAPLYVICQSGGRGREACEWFRKAGFADAINVEGGMTAWLEAGLPVVRGKKAISLERQVRIAAGSLVLVGILLAWLVHSAFVGLSAFVGAGLVFAGVTDTCGMGMVLARMPWNQRQPTAASCGSGVPNSTQPSNVL